MSGVWWHRLFCALGIHDWVHGDIARACMRCPRVELYR